LKIAILGATSHLAKGLIYNFLNDDKFSLSLYTRNIGQVNSFIDSIGKTGSKNYSVIYEYDDFLNYSYDLIINCTGAGTYKKLDGKFSSFFTITEKYDNLCIQSLLNYPGSLYISFSSGAVYGRGLSKPVNENTSNKLRVNHLKPEDFYTIARLNAENKHRAFNNLKIVDLRIFSYFSRFIDLADGYFIAEIIDSIINNRILITNKSNIVRDYVHPEDIFSLILKCAEKDFINEAFDVMSAKPIDKYEILDFFSRKYDLKYEMNDEYEHVNSTGTKIVYYSRYNKASMIGFKPGYTSAEAIKSEAEIIIKNNKSML